MLTITIPAGELWDENTNTFVQTKAQTLELEHSLISVSKWESKWGVAFLAEGQKSDEQLTDYIRDMTITRGVDPVVYLTMSADVVATITDYIAAPMTATKINERQTKSNDELVTAELIYYWMISLNIPFECRKWHLNRLLTLVRVINIKNSPQKKLSRAELAARNRAENARRKAALKTSG